MPSVHGHIGSSPAVHNVELRLRALEPDSSPPGLNPVIKLNGAWYSGSARPRLPSGELMSQLGGWSEVTASHAVTAAPMYKPAADMSTEFGLGGWYAWHNGIYRRFGKAYIPAKKATDEGGRNYPTEFYDINSYRIDKSKWPEHIPSALSEDTLSDAYAPADRRDVHQTYYRNKIIDVPKPLSYPNNMPDLVAQEGLQPNLSANLGEERKSYVDMFRYAPKNLHDQNNILQRWYTTQTHMRNIRKADEDLQLSLAGSPNNPGANRSITLFDTESGVNLLAEQSCQDSSSPRREMSPTRAL